jgi:hypothetical protein
MSKPVQFVGFESRPELRDQLERLVPDLWREVGRWANRVEAVFRLTDPNPEQPKVALTLSLKLPHVEGKDTDVVQFRDVEDPDDFRGWVRFVWENVLDNILNQRIEEYLKDLPEPQGA